MPGGREYDFRYSALSLGDWPLELPLAYIEVVVDELHSQQDDSVPLVGDLEAFAVNPS